MTCRSVNPWAWQDAFGFSQGIEVRNAGRVLLISGQTSIDADGTPGAVGDMHGQTAAAVSNLETVLHAAEMTFANLARLVVYTTDIDLFLADGHEHLVTRIGHAAYALTLLGVSRLAFPELLVEIEATAVAGD